ncbi:HAMP domain-containing histidine kinase [Rhodoplanes sp. Z2-YC6860]|uniref:HAMP domain-containing histidine kinase n=1 Tax=Rhodoplanes sp. Z2-YC6860 TaxID=674703 RepID=UPI00083448D5|nr:HAMP domain-containing histidine kinase [Rhodoplanes sp. Z2-YC6860]
MNSSKRSTTVPAGYQSLDLQRVSDFHAALLGLAGHDLRQPLRVIQGTYDLLRTRAWDTSQQAWLKSGEQAVTKLTEQLDRLLGALRLYESTNAMEVSSVSLAPLFWRLRHENEEAALRRGIDMRVCSTKACVLGRVLIKFGAMSAFDPKATDLPRRSEPTLCAITRHYPCWHQATA